MLAAIGVGFLLTVAGFKAIVPEDPYAMLDDTYLNTLKSDDDVANDAARKVWCVSWRGVGSLPCFVAVEMVPIFNVRCTQFVPNVLFPLPPDSPSCPTYYTRSVVPKPRQRPRARTDPSSASRVTTKPWREAGCATNNIKWLRTIRGFMLPKCGICARPCEVLYRVVPLALLAY